MCMALRSFKSSQNHESGCCSAVMLESYWLRFESCSVGVVPFIGRITDKLVGWVQLYKTLNWLASSDGMSRWSCMTPIMPEDFIPCMRFSRTA